MRTFIKLLPNGLISATCHAPDEWAGSPEDMEEGFVELVPSPALPFDFTSIRLAGNALVARPTLPLPVLTAPAGERHIAWTALPAGASVSVADSDTGQELGTEQEVDGAITVELHEPGTYRVTLQRSPEYMDQQVQVVL